jgi:Mg2+ and Co2+ transporter CorA
MPSNKITLQPTAGTDNAVLTAQGRTQWQNQAIHDLLDRLIQEQNDIYTPLPSRYPVDKKGNLLPSKERELVFDRLLKRLKVNRDQERELANQKKELENQVYTDIDERFKPYIEGLTQHNQKMKELLSSDRNIQSLREGIAADEQSINLLRKSADIIGKVAPKLGSNPYWANPITELAPEIRSIQSQLASLTSSLNTKKQYLQDIESASGAFSQEIPEIIDFPISALRDETLRSDSMSDPLVQQAVKDDYDISKDAIRDVLQGDPGRRNAFLNKIEAGGESILPDADQISNYLSDRNQRASSAILNEMTENYLTNILPKGNLGFMSGAWNSPQRGTHQQSLLRNLGKDAYNTLMKMEVDATKTGLAEAGEQQKRGLYSGQLGSEALNKGIETQVGAAQGLANIEKAQSAEEFGALEAVGRLGQERQQAEENRLLEIQKEFQKQQNRPVENTLQALGAITNVPSQTMSDILVQQQQPNYAAIGGYGLGNLGTALLMPQMGYQGRKGGGLVQKFADGGMALPQAPDDQYRQELEQEAEQLRGTQVQDVNPMAAAIARMTDSMAQRYTGMTPIAGHMVDAYQERAQAQEARKMRGLNLMQQIHTSRIKQQEFLAEMDYKNRHLASQEKQHAETSRHHQAMEGFKERELTPGAGKLTPTDRKAEREAIANIRRAKSMKGELDNLQGLLGKTETGPIIGKLKSLPYAKTELADQVEVATNKLILDMHQGMKNIPRSEEFMKRIESTKPGMQHHEKANKKAIELMKEGANDVEQNAIDTLVGLGYSPEKIQELLGSEASNENVEQKSSMSADEIMNSDMSLDQKKEALRKIAHG